MAVVQEDALDDGGPELSHALSQPRRDMSVVERQVGKSGALHTTILDPERSSIQDRTPDFIADALDWLVGKTLFELREIYLDAQARGLRQRDHAIFLHGIGAGGQLLIQRVVSRF